MRLVTTARRGRPADDRCACDRRAVRLSTRSRSSSPTTRASPRRSRVRPGHGASSSSHSRRMRRRSPKANKHAAVLIASDYQETKNVNTIGDDILPNTTFRHVKLTGRAWPALTWVVPGDKRVCCERRRASLVVASSTKKLTSVASFDGKKIAIDRERPSDLFASGLETKRASQGQARAARGRDGRRRAHIRRDSTRNRAACVTRSRRHRRLERHRRGDRARACCGRLALRPARAARGAAASARRRACGGEYELCDVGRREAVDARRRACCERHPQIQLLVNNAGIPGRAAIPRRSTRSASSRSCGRTTSAACGACARSCPRSRPRAVRRREHRLGRRHGRVPPAGPYSASKHAQLAFSRATTAACAAAGSTCTRSIRASSRRRASRSASALRSAVVRRLVIEPEDVARHVLRS